MSGFTFIKSYIQLRNNQKKSRDEILKLQDKKFRKILKFVYKKSSFYKNLYESKNINEKDLNEINIEDLPIVER